MWQTTFINELQKLAVGPSIVKDILEKIEILLVPCMLNQKKNNVASSI